MLLKKEKDSKTDKLEKLSMFQIYSGKVKMPKHKFYNFLWYTF